MRGRFLAAGLGRAAALFLSLAVPDIAGAQATSPPSLSAEHHDAGTLEVSWTGVWPGYHIIHCEAPPGGNCDPDHGEASNHIGHIFAFAESGDGIWDKCSANWDDGWATDFSCILDGLADGSTHCYKLGDMGEGKPTYFSDIACATVAMPSVSLLASPNPVDEGQSLTLTARLSEELPNSVTIPLVLSSGTAEPEDVGSLASITVADGQTTGTGTLSTVGDADADDETFTVSLGALPSQVTSGEPSSVKVTIRDDEPPPPNNPPSVRATCEPCTVPTGGEVRLRAEASDPDGDPISYDWSADSGRFRGPKNKETVRWRAPDKSGSFEVRVRVSDGRGGSASVSVVVEGGQTAHFATASASVPEGGTARLRVRLSPASNAPTPLEYVFGSDGDPNTSDANPADYREAGGTLSIPAGQTEAVIGITITQDFEIEPAREVFTVTLRVPNEYRNDIDLTTATATVIIDEGVCDRTPEVRDALRGAVACSAVTAADLNGRRSLALADMEIDALQSRDFAYLPALRHLDIHGNRLQTLPSGLLSGLGNLETLRLDGNSLTELGAGALGDLSRLRQLRLDGNRLAALPDGLFLGVRSLSELRLHDNPGTPFVLTLALARTDAAVRAPGPATVVATVAEGTPFTMRQSVSAGNGELSTDEVVVLSANATSDPVTVTRTGEGGVRVALDAAPRIPTRLCGDDGHPCFQGIATAAGPTLVLFKNPLRATDSPPALELLAVDDATTVDLATLFAGAEGETLTYVVESSDPELLTVRVEGGNLVLLPNEVGEGGEVTVTLKATDEDGLTATVSLVITIEPNLRSFLRGWRKALFERQETSDQAHGRT